MDLLSSTTELRDRLESHRDPQRAMAAAAKALDATLRDLEGLTPAELRRQRRDRFYAIGREGV
jgi:acetyl-CoA carboxylase carboxyl transferase subunit alpha